MDRTDYNDILDTMEEVTDDRYMVIKKALNKVICDNLQALIEARGFSYGEFCKQLAHEKTSVTRAQFHKIIRKPQSMSIAFVLSCCDFFGISLQNLCSKDFDPTEYVYNDSNTHADYLNIKCLLDSKRSAVSEKEGTLTGQGNLMDAIAAGLRSCKNTDLVVDPSSSQFKGYLQDYYCYYFPTNSTQNKGDDKIIKGILNLKEEDGFCKAVLTIDSGTVDEEGNINYKIYTGYTAISTSVNSVTCMMYSEDLCEFCFLMFRYFRLNFGKQHCRIAEVLSSSSATEDRRPTVLRMFLSKEAIKDEDVKMIAPAFSLNYSTVAIAKEDLEKIAKISTSHSKVVEELLNISSSKKMVFCKEYDIKQVGKRYLDTNMQTLQLVMQIRDKSYAYKYNKIGGKADDIVRALLLEKGYYKS